MSEAVARRYARAVFELAREDERVGEVLRELDLFAEIYRTSSEFRALEHTPELSDEDRAKYAGENREGWGQELAELASYMSGVKA